MAKEEQIKSQIILEGEKEYRAACKGINTSLREIGSEMKLATAEFGDNAESIEALTRKQDILQKQLDEQAKKAKAAEAALKKMREGGIDPTDPAYQKMQTNLNNTRAEMVKVQRELDDTSKKLKSSKIDWESVGDTVGKVGKAIGAGVAAMGAAIGAAATAFLGLAESTREARENMGKLEAGFTTAGHSAEDAKNTYTELYGILGDDGQATEAAAHLAQLTNNEQELATWTDIATGVYATFGDSLPIEGLTEAANETAKTGAITGSLADALNWAGVSEDEFQASLDKCTTEQERQALITETLNGLYSDAAEAYSEINGDIIEAQKATANLNSAMAALGAIAEPIVTKLKQLATELLQQITPFVELIGTGLTGALEGAEGAAKRFSEGLLGLVTFIVEQLGTMLPTFTEFALQMIGTLATGIAQALPTLVPAIVQIITQLVQTLMDNIPMLIDAALQLITGLAQGIINAVPVLVAALPTLITSLVNGLLEAIPQIIQTGIDLITSLVTALPEIIATIVAAIPEIINGIITALIDNIPLIAQAGNDLLVALIQALPQIITTIVQAIPQIISGIVDAIVGSIDKIKCAGTELMNGLWEGISGAASGLWEKISGWAASIIDGIKSIFGIASPSTEMQSIGKYLLDGLSAGLLAGVESVLSTVADVFGRIWDAIKRIFGFGDASQESKDAKQAGADIMTGLKDGITGSEGDVKTAITTAAQNAIQAFRDELGAASGPSTKTKEFGQALVDGINTGLSETTSASFAAGIGVVSSALETAINEALGVQGTGFLGMGGNSATKYVGIGQAVIKAIADGIASSDVNSDAIKTALITVVNTAYESAMAEMAVGITGSSDAVNAAVIEAVNTAITAAETAASMGSAIVGTTLADTVIGGIRAKTTEITNAGTAIATAIAGGMSQAVGQITDKVPGIVQVIIAAFTAQHAKALNEGIDLDKQIGTGMVQGVTNITSKVSGIVQTVITAFTAQQSKFVSAGQDIDKAIAQGMVSAAGQISSKVSGIMTPVVSAVNSFKGQMTDAGENMVRGIWQGFSNMRSWLESKVRAMMRDIVAAIKNEMKISSPSKVLASLGEFMAKG